MTDKRLVVLVGATGSGKTDLSIRLAKHYRAPILSTDSRQVYRGMPIGTAQPTNEQLKAIEHHFIATLDIQQDFNCGQYEVQALELLRQLFVRHDTVIAVGGSGILLHEAIGHTFEADFNRKNVSIFADQLNKKVCNEHINVVDDGTIPFNRGSVNFDDEGAEGQKTYLIKDGVLTSYLHDRISAKHYGVEPTGNGRRESFRNMPIPRMRATYMEAGNVSESDIISSVKKGIFVDNFTNGQVQIGAGDFTFFVKSGYMIEDGKLTQPIKDINIIGNGPKALADITMVATNAKIDNGTWTCGKDGQSCPVTCGMPSALVSKLTVGGEN